MTAKKSKAKKIVKKSNGAAKRPVAILKKEGVVATIVACISKEKGASKDEIRAVLIKTFPDRDPEQMNNTLSTQLSRHSKKKVDDDKRGRVYFGQRS
jgi:hypothetical protein